MRRAVIAAVTLLIVGAGLFWWWRLQRSAAAQPLVVYCPAEFQSFVDDMAKSFQQEAGTAVRVEAGPPSILLRQIETARNGDVFLARDAHELQLADDKALIVASTPMVVLRAMVGVKPGNPAKVQSIADLLKPEIRLSLPDPKSSSLGQAVKTKLGGRWGELWNKGILLGAGPNEVAAHIANDMADATFVWDSTSIAVPGIATVEVAEFADVDGAATASVLRSSKQPAVAQSFVDYLTAGDRGGAALAKRGYRPGGGKSWSPPPAR